MSRVDRSDFRRFTAATGGVRHAAHYALKDLCQGMEGGLLIPENLSVDQIIVRGIDTVNYIAQMHEYMLCGHIESFYADAMSCFYNVD